MTAEIESNANIIENQPYILDCLNSLIMKLFAVSLTNIKKTKTVEENIIDINVVENTFLLFFSFTENLKNAVSIPYVKIIVKKRYICINFVTTPYSEGGKTPSI